MNHEQIEQLLRRHRPVGPPSTLRGRCLAAVPAPRTWPWAAAAAILLAGTMALYSGTERLIQRTDIPPASDDAAAAREVIAAWIGDEATAQEIAELMAAEQQMQTDDRDPSDVEWAALEQDIQ